MNRRTVAKSIQALSNSICALAEPSKSSSDKPTLEVSGRKGDKEKTFTIKAEIDSTRFDILHEGGKGNWSFLSTYAEHLVREIEGVNKAWGQMKLEVETWLKSSFKNGNMKKSKLNYDYETKRPKVFLQKEFVMDIPDEIDLVFEETKKKFGSSYNVIKK